MHVDFRMIDAALPPASAPLEAMVAEMDALYDHDRPHGRAQRHAIGLRAPCGAFLVGGRR